MESGDGWWHGFQHGIQVIGHAAPITCLMGKSTVYFASSFTSKEKGIITCASDPTIDNHLRFCQVKVVHDGYEFDRQDKVRDLAFPENGDCHSSESMLAVRRRRKLL